MILVHSICVLLFPSLTLDVSHTYRTSRKNEIGAQYRISKLMNTRQQSIQSTLYGQILSDNQKFTEMIKSRVTTGSSFRFEYSFHISEFQTEVQMNEAVTLIDTILKGCTEEYWMSRVRVVKPSLFPKAINTIHTWLWESIEPIINNVLNQNAHAGLKFAQRELVSFVERLMIVNINGNLERNLNGPTPNALRVVSSIGLFNWPYLEVSLIDKINWGVFFHHPTNPIALVPSPSRLLLFAFLPPKYRLICSQNVTSLINLEDLICRLETDDFDLLTETNNAVKIFKEMIMNFINEVGTFCCEKLLEKSKKSTSTLMFRQRCHQLNLLNKEIFFESTSASLGHAYASSGSEIFIIPGKNISPEDLWQQHVISGAYSRLNLPDWFSAFSSLVGFQVILNEWAETSETASAMTLQIMEFCKGKISIPYLVTFIALMKKQQIWIPPDTKVMWRNPGQFIRISETPILTHVVIRNQTQIMNQHVQVTVIQSRIVPRPSIDRISFLVPQNAKIWANATDERIKSYKVLIQKHYPNNLALEQKIPRVWSESLSDGDKWLILCSLILSEIQPRMPNIQTVSSCPEGVNKFKPKENYGAHLLVSFLIEQRRMPVPDLQLVWKKAMQNYCISNSFIERYVRTGIPSVRYIACFSPTSSVASYLKNFDIPENVTNNIV